MSTLKFTLGACELALECGLDWSMVPDGFSCCVKKYYNLKICVLGFVCAFDFGQLDRLNFCNASCCF